MEEVESNTRIIDVADLMLTHKIHHAIVMENGAINGAIKGIVSALDFVKLFIEQNKP